jgi:hypothetical protein
MDGDKGVGPIISVAREGFGGAEFLLFEDSKNQSEEVRCIS